MTSSQSYFSQRRTMQYSYNLQKIVLIPLSILIISYILLPCCHAFQTLPSLSTAATGRYAYRHKVLSKPSTDHQYYSSSIIPTTRRRSQLSMAIRHTSTTSTNHRIQSSTTTINLSTKSKLFPQRTTQSTRQSNTIRSLLMSKSSNNEVSADNSNEETNCPVTKLMTSFRKLLARFWVSFFYTEDHIYRCQILIT